MRIDRIPFLCADMRISSYAQAALFSLFHTPLLLAEGIRALDPDRRGREVGLPFVLFD